ncbi:hypothetical protein I553_8779 [Mycobacterium xenopi 4042]|uniref:Uncharacterized protein n=1 Tax=Mycobacterium xenopi 4042 TaxID=1299334 RepID=X8CN81_MYCXE|nr:hypothetical protein I553_8779 [Mycobacterium xenopi 4042]
MSDIGDTIMRHSNAVDASFLGPTTSIPRRQISWVVRSYG